jgi:hypothetical protein
MVRKVTIGHDQHVAMANNFHILRPGVPNIGVK